VKSSKTSSTSKLEGNINGKSFVPPVVDQRDCNSCYAVAGVNMLSARYRILKNNPDREEFSLNFPLYCSDLNQGCTGGFASLISMWSKDVGLIPKSCAGDYFTNHSESCQSLMKNLKKDQFEGMKEPRT
jgi:hypothetical protein